MPLRQEVSQPGSWGRALLPALCALVLPAGASLGPASGAFLRPAPRVPRAVLQPSPMQFSPLHHSVPQAVPLGLAGLLTLSPLGPRTPSCTARLQAVSWALAALACLFPGSQRSIMPHNAYEVGARKG